jgi:putative transcriptional regulator
VSEGELATSLLVAMPQLGDPNFRRCVVQLIHHDETGTFGLVINRGSGVSTGDLCEQLDIDWGGDPDLEVGTGGPVQPETGWVLYGDGAPEDIAGAQTVGPGLHFVGSLDALRQLGEEPPDQVRLFLGYAGWAPGQLEMELTQGSWLAVPSRPDFVFDGREEEVWQRVLGALGIDPASLVPTPGVH